MRLEDYLYKWFGYNVFRQGQKDVIVDLLQGKNVVAMLPTGGGKSLCYQLQVSCKMEQYLLFHRYYP